MSGFERLLCTRLAVTTQGSKVFEKLNIQFLPPNDGVRID